MCVCLSAYISESILRGGLGRCTECSQYIVKYDIVWMESIKSKKKNGDHICIQQGYGQGNIKDTDLNKMPFQTL